MNSEREILAKRNKEIWRRQRIPVSDFFELTPRCTLDCRMCYVHLTPEQMGERKELTAEQWNRITDEAVEAGMLYVVLTGGECMLHPDFWEIYEHLRDKGVVVTINTNAFAMTDADIERFLRKPPAAFRITLYGASEEGYARCTGHRAFSRVVENIKKLRDTGIRTAVAITLCRYNMDEFVDMVRIVKSLRLPVNYVMELSEPNEDTGRHLDSFSLSQEEIITKSKELYLAENRPIFDNEPIRELPALLPDDPTCRGMRCGSGTTSFVIHWDGRMSPCFDFRNEIRVQDVGFRAAWEATKQLAASRLQPVECETCRLLPICHECVLCRQDPRNPGHADPNRCKMTIGRYNAGLCTLHDQTANDRGLIQKHEEC